MGNAKEAVLNGIAAQEWLDRASDPLQASIRDALPREVKNALHGVFLGHPLHPVLTDIPVGAWTCTLALDAVEVMSGRKDFAPGADAVLGIGLLGALGAAVTGATDWSETQGRGKKLGLMHGLLNVVATTLYTSSWIMRKKKKTRQTGIALSMLGYAVANASAYLGGHLVFGEQIGVDHTATADSSVPSDFTRVAAAADLQEGRPMRVVADGVAICLVKRGGSIHAISDTCSHLGGPLSEGTLDGDVIECPWHGSRFDVTTGDVVDGPATFSARTFAVRVNGADVEVRAENKQAAVDSD
jgi:nitrite reductase/ring-hydroxylating ferredoxin subunit/uncharacterized membrane protein